MKINPQNDLLRALTFQDKFQNKQWLDVINSNKSKFYKSQ